MNAFNPFTRNTAAVARKAPTLADLRDEAARLIPDDWREDRTAGLGSIGKYTIAEKRASIRAILTTPAIHAELIAEAHAKFGGDA